MTAANTTSGYAIAVAFEAFENTFEFKPQPMYTEAEILVCKKEMYEDFCKEMDRVMRKFYKTKWIGTLRCENISKCSDIVSQTFPYADKPDRSIYFDAIRKSAKNLGLTFKVGTG